MCCLELCLHNFIVIDFVGHRLKREFIIVRWVSPIVPRDLIDKESQRSSMFGPICSFSYLCLEKQMCPCVSEGPE